MAVLNANTVSDGGTNVTARVWANFNGVVNQVGVRGGYNATSVTRHALGNYTLNYSITLPNTSYCVLLTGSSSQFSSANCSIGIYAASGNDNQANLTTTSVRMLQQAGSGANVDTNSIHVLVFR